MTSASGMKLSEDEPTPEVVLGKVVGCARHLRDITSRTDNFFGEFIKLENEYIKWPG